MNLTWLLTMMLIALQIQIIILMDLSLIRGFFIEKQAKYATVFSCFTKTGHLQFAKNILNQENDIKTSFFNTIYMNVSKADLMVQSTHIKISVIVDGDCPNVEEILKICGEKKLFDVKHHWLITSSSFNITEKLRQVNLNINADLQLAIPNDNEEGEWLIYDVYNAATKYGGQLNVSLLGYYNKANGYNARIKDAIYWTRKNMTGVTLRTMVVLPTPYKGTLQSYLDSNENPTENSFNRFQARLHRYCRDYYNFTMNMSTHTSWGYIGPDGSFDGMVGAINHSEIDFGSSPVFVRTDRATVVDYGRHTWIWRAAFIFRNPKVPTSMESFFKPLSTSIWLLTGVFAILSIIILKLVTTYEKHRLHETVDTSWSVSVLLTIGAFCQQGSPSTPFMTCGRITTITIFLFSVIIYQFYSASIVSILLMKPVTLIKTLRDLLESPLQVGCEDALYTKDYFRHTTDKTSKDFYNKKMVDKRNVSHYLPPNEGLRLVHKGGYAYHTDVYEAYPKIEATFDDQAICELREVTLFRTQGLYTNYQKKSPFRDMLETCIQRMTEYGIIYRERKFWHPRKPECVHSSQSATFHVGIYETYPVFVIYSTGLLISLIVFITEKQIAFRKALQRHIEMKKVNSPLAFVD